MTTRAVLRNIMLPFDDKSLARWFKAGDDGVGKRVESMVVLSLKQRLQRDPGFRGYGAFSTHAEQ